jgi:superfamily II DNA or RNA helicase
MKNIDLRDWQTVAQRLWVDNNYRGCVSVATGGGKTIFAISCFIRLQSLNPAARILVIVPSIALLDQWYSSFVSDFGLDESSIKILKSKDMKPDSVANLVIINSARAIEEWTVGDDSLFLVVDECHRAASPENAKALRVKSQYTLGLSATPYREYDSLFTENVEPRLGKVIFEYSLTDAVRDGVLAQMQIQNLRIPLTAKEQVEYEKYSRLAARAFGAGNIDAAHIALTKRARVSNNASFRVPTVVALLNGLRESRVIVFFESISELERAAALLSIQGHHLVTYHSKVSDHLRRSNLMLFRRGAFDVLLTCRALDEGFNVPEASVAIIAAGTASKRQRTQRIGRVLRALPGKGTGTVITIYATDEEEQKLVQEIERLDLKILPIWSKARI